MGPGASRLNLAKQRAKWRERIYKIAGAHVAASAATDLYRIYSASVLGYLGQILSPPDDLFSEERKLIHSIFKLPLIFLLLFLFVIFVMLLAFPQAHICCG